MAAESAPHSEPEVPEQVTKGEAIPDPAAPAVEAGLGAPVDGGGGSSAIIGGREMTAAEGGQIGDAFDRSDLQYRPYLKR